MIRPGSRVAAAAQQPFVAATSYLVKIARWVQGDRYRALEGDMSVRHGLLLAAVGSLAVLMVPVVGAATPSAGRVAHGYDGLRA